MTLACYYGIAVPVGVALAFKGGKGVEGLRAGILVGQLVLVTFYSILIDCLTNWQSVAHEAQERIYKESINLPLAMRRASDTSNSKPSYSDQEGGALLGLTAKDIRKQ